MRKINEGTQVRSHVAKQGAERNTLVNPNFKPPGSINVLSRGEYDIEYEDTYSDIAKKNKLLIKYVSEITYLGDT